MAVFEDPRVVAVTAPLAVDAPLGVDVRDDPIFEQIEIEVRRIDTEGPAGVRWAQVASGGLELITTRGRDLLLVSWTIYALTQTERWRGLAVGVSALAPMIVDHWEAILPRRERARVGALDWLTGRMVPLLTEMELEHADAAAALHASAILDQLQPVLASKLVKEQVAIGELVRLLRAKAAQARELVAQSTSAGKAVADAEKTAATASSPDAAPLALPQAAAAPARADHERTVLPPPLAAAVTPPPPPPAPAPDADMGRALSALADSMRLHAARLRDANLADPRSYHLTRLSAWLDITTLPQATGITTQLFPPAAQRLQSLEALQRAGEHDAAIRMIEGMIAAAPFWLDAHRLVCDGLAALGPRHGLAVDAVLAAVAGLVHRLPGLVELTFSDGMPFADAATRDWLNQHAGSGTTAPPEMAGEGLSELQQDVRALIVAGDKAAALDRLTTARAAARDGRQAFEIQILQAQLCLDMDLPGVALPLAVHLQAVSDARSLDCWEPSLALGAAGLAMRAFRHPAAVKLLGEDRLRMAVAATQQRLAALDLRVAARLSHA